MWGVELKEFARKHKAAVGGRDGGMDSWIGGVAGGGDATEIELGGACALEGRGGKGVR